MKLLQLNVTANWGSTGKIAEGIGLAAMKRGWESAIAYGRYMNPSESKLIKVGTQLDVYAHYAKARFLDGEGLGSSRATKELIRRIDALMPDVLHLHNIHDHWLNYPLLFHYLERTNVPVVWTFHDCWAFTGGCPHFENAGCNRWRASKCQGGCILHFKRAAGNFEAKRELFSRIADRLTIVPVSNWLERYVNDSFLKEAGAKVMTIHNGIDVYGVFHPGTVPKERLILGVSNVWDERKGLPHFFRLRDLLPADVAMLIVGLTPAQLKSLPPGIQGMTRTTDAEELAALYRRAAVFVNPTLDDNFPTVNLEALACGTPVVTYRTGGSPEAVNDRTGHVIDKGDVGALADAVMKVINKADTFSGEDCRLRAVTHFNQQIQFNKYIDLYEEMLKTK